MNSPTPQDEKSDYTNEKLKVTSQKHMSLSREEEENLIAGCVRNDRRSQERLYKSFYQPMMRMCLRYTRDEEKAMDILNSGFLEVFKNIQNFSRIGSLGGWIRVIIVRSIADYYRKHERYTTHVMMIEKDVQVEADAVSNLYIEDLRSMINELPNTARIIFNMHAVEGFTHEEIAAFLGISAGTSKWYVSKAREKLHAIIKKNYPALAKS